MIPARTLGRLIPLLAVALVAAPPMQGQEAPSPLDAGTVRDIFAGFGGDLVALQRGREAARVALDAAPDDVEVLAWHGAATLGWGSLSPAPGIAERIRLFQQATSAMDRAVDLAPDNVRVRMARGVVLRILTPGMPKFDNVPGLIERARADYQRLFELQEARLAELGTHPLGELLEGLGDLHSRQGKTEDAARYYGLMQSMLEGTEYAARAAAWMATREPPTTSPTTCVGCHTP